MANLHSLKNPTTSVGFQPANLGTKGHHATPTPPKLSIYIYIYKRRNADNSLARPGRKQATTNKLGIYSTYSPRSSIHSLARCSNFCKPLKKKSDRCPSNQVSAAEMTASDEKWRPFNCFFFSPGNRW